MARPRVKLRCVANTYAGPNERIIEFSSKLGGGLIAFRECSDGLLSVSVYQCDLSVSVSAPMRHARPLKSLSRRGIGTTGITTSDVR